jgi:hypothetical protein
MMTFHSQLFLESQSKFHGSSHHQPVVVDGDGTTVLGDVTLWKMGHLWMSYSNYPVKNGYFPWLK